MKIIQKKFKFAVRGERQLPEGDELHVSWRPDSGSGHRTFRTASQAGPQDHAARWNFAQVHSARFHDHHR